MNFNKFKILSQIIFHNISFYMKKKILGKKQNNKNKKFKNIEYVVFLIYNYVN